MTISWEDPLIKRFEECIRINNINTSLSIFNEHFCFKRIRLCDNGIVYSQDFIAPVFSCQHRAFYTMCGIKTGDIKLTDLVTDQNTVKVWITECILSLL